MKTWIKIFILIGIVLVADLTTKHFLCEVEYFNLIPNVISIATNHGNDGAAWGIFSGKRLFLILISLIMIAALLIFDHFTKNKNGFYTVAMGLILGGALGNLFDRIAFGSVRDFIFLDFFPSFPVFNLADSCLCIGAILLAIFILFMGKEKKR